MKKISLLFLLLFSTSLINLAFAGISGDELGDEEPLMPDQAFVLSSSVIDGNTLRVRWDIVKGYYMYRDKFKFTTDTANVTLGDASYPPGKIKEDEFFGKVETYRKKAVIDIPIERTGDVKKLTLTTVSQGCADIGICYPPQTQTVSFDLPPPETLQTFSSSTPQSSSFSTLKKLGASLGLIDSTEEFLTADQAFSFSSEVVDGNNIRVSWNIADGYYLYRDKFKFEIKDANGITIGAANFPRGEIKNDEYFGDMEVFHDKVDANVALLRTNLTATDITLVAKYQGCAEAGFCYPPQTQNMPMALPVGLAAPAAGTSSSSSDDDDIDISETDQIASALGKGSTILTMLSFFGFGLLLAFTPCVFPMIPILSSIIVGQGEHITTRRAFTLSLVYVLAMALTYTFAGVMAGLFGENLQAAFQNPWILGTFAGVFVLLSLSMFGFYDLQMPASIQSKFTNVSNSQQGGTLIGVGVMGFLSALIVGPCVAAPLAGALIYIGQTGDAVLGGFALFALSLGMGAPLLAIGTSAGKLLPKAGGWMDTIKAVFGVMLLAVAIWMLERILPVEVIMLMIAALAIICAIFMGALEPVGAGATGWRKFWKGSGIMLFVYGVILVISAAAGGKSYMQPLHGIAMGVSSSSGMPGAVAAEHIKFKRVRGLEGFERELAAANAANKPVMLDFYADWCISCKEMEKYTFTDPDVQAALSKAVLLQADVTKNDAIDKALLKRFSIFGPPSIMFFGTDGKERRKYRVIGFMKPEKFSKIATKGLQ